MSKFFDRLLDLCDREGTTPRRVAQDIGIKTSTLSMWKTKGVIPNTNTIIELAKYFATSPEYLLGTSDISGPCIDIDKRDQATKNYVKSRFTEAEAWSARKDEIGEDLAKLNDEGQQEAVKRVKELTEIAKYKRKKRFSPLTAGIDVYGDGSLWPRSCRLRRWPRRRAP